MDPTETHGEFTDGKGFVKAASISVRCGLPPGASPTNIAIVVTAAATNSKKRVAGHKSDETVVNVTVISRPAGGVAPVGEAKGCWAEGSECTDMMAPSLALSWVKEPTSYKKEKAGSSDGAGSDSAGGLFPGTGAGTAGSMGVAGMYAMLE